MKKDVIIACDFPNKESTFAFLDLFQGLAQKPYLKIGMELFYGEGPDIVRAIKDQGYLIFLDLKLHDIPNTVKKAMTNLARLGVDMTNLHAAGTIAMMKAAKEGLDAGSPSGKKVDLIAVTQLTSTSAQMLQEELLIHTPMEDTVLAYAKNAQVAGLQGVVCSPLEAKAVKEVYGNSFITVTPGIRYPSGVKDDQQRVTTPTQAAAIGTDYIVVGRPITAAQDPLAAYNKVCKDFLGL
ncbi:MAG: orotidine-5'-phosphate decarboxylase [Clostridiales bacterium]|nr:orotidine-5'-phosphate decarboxylase [Clostridiales bacterium]